MFENIFVIIVIFLAIAFTLRKISKTFSGNELNCGSCTEKGCTGCRDTGSPYSGAENKHVIIGRDPR